ncbi:hypothetical protein I3760_02G026800 [Carya illinoinensis]|nr:hypothetical protein I3760_02G026800 [Carya illinoinensis]
MKVYFVNETVKNLKAEVARVSKIKCSKCGRKGAALGCYVKSYRKSYRVPFAVEMSDCLWDHVLVLKFASMCGATVTKCSKSNVTHVIATTDAQDACTRTLKVLMAILNGRWILKIGCKLPLMLFFVVLISSLTFLYETSRRSRNSSLWDQNMIIKSF